MQPYVGAMITPSSAQLQVSSVAQKVISVVFRSRAPKPLYMFICIIQIAAGEQQQQPAHSASVSQPAQQKQVHHHSVVCGYRG